MITGAGKHTESKHVTVRHDETGVTAGVAGADGGVGFWLQTTQFPRATRLMQLPSREIRCLCTRQIDCIRSLTQPPPQPTL